MTARSTSSPDRFAKTATSRRTVAPSDTEAPAPPRRIGRTGQRTDLVRTTVDLTPAEHRRLRAIADRLAEDLDAREIPRRAIHRALLDELHSDEALYERIRDRIALDREE